MAASDQKKIKALNWQKANKLKIYGDVTSPFV
jgi:hypothetical protein